MHHGGLFSIGRRSATRFRAATAYRDRPVTRYGYDLLGRLVSTTDLTSSHDSGAATSLLDIASSARQFDDFYRYTGSTTGKVATRGGFISIEPKVRSGR